MVIREGWVLTFVHAAAHPFRSATEPGRVHHRRCDMSNLRGSLVTLFAFTVILIACSGSAASQQPSPSPAPVASPSGPPLPITTPEAAMAAIVAAEPRFAGIGPKDPELIGQSAWYEARPASGVGAFVVMIQMGWGDCQAGCIERHTWTYAVAPDGTVTLLSEAGDPVPTDGATGITGHASAGPTCPVEQPGDPACAPRPVAGAVVVVTDASGAEVGKATTLPDGSFAIELPPGDYSVQAGPVEGVMSAPAVVAVTVQAGSLALVDLQYDTGIR